jgi:membrane protease YdiL (CAAX protease family)
MRPHCALAGYLLVVFLGGALLAPWLYEAVQWAGGSFGWAQSLAAQPFHRFVSRSLLGLAVLGLWPLSRALGLRSWRDLGLQLSQGDWRRLGAGLTVGFGSLAAVAGVAVAVGARQIEAEHDMTSLLRHVSGAALSAGVVAVIEETVFRGALFGGLRRAGSWPGALAVSSAVYALVHFFDRPESPSAVNWLSGLVTLGGMLRGFVEWERLVPGFFNLTVAGMILALAYHRTGTLAFSVGLHAGWVFWLKSYGFLTTAAAGEGLWIWGTRRLIDGWLAGLVLAGTLYVCARWVLPAPAVQGKARAEGG